MIDDLKPYPKYVDSGHEWLAPLPAHWGQLRAKQLFREVDERSSTGREELLSVSHITGVTPRSQKTITMFLAKSNIGHKICRPGDAVINTMWAWMGALGVTRHTGIVSPAYGVYRPLPDCPVLPEYAGQLLRIPAYVQEYQRRSTGVNSSRLRLYPDAFLRIPVVVPPPDEQAAIVQFLSWVNGPIERAIHAKRKVISLLNEQKQAIIHRAVTRGLNHAVSLKPSGIPWLGAIPQHWEVRPLKRMAWFKGGAGFPIAEQARTDLEIPFLKVSDMTRAGNNIWIETQNNTVSLETANRLGAHIFPSKTIIFPKVGGAMLTNKRRLTRRPSCIDNNLMGCVVRQGDMGFVFLLLQQLDLGRLSKPGPVPAISEGEVREIKVVYPPISEQSQLVTFVQRETGQLNVALAHLDREIELLREYRTRLVSDVVTGKIDVRGTAAQVPENVAPGIAEEGLGFNLGPDAIDEEAVD